MTAANDQRPDGLLAFVFPGVGTTLGGSESGFYARHEGLIRPRLEAASEAAGIDLVTVIRSGVVPSEPALASQLFGYAFSVAVAEVLRSAGVEPTVTAGHSLGLYAALQVARAIGFEEGLRITVDAYECARSACPPGEHGLQAVVGFPRADLEGLLRTHDEGTLRVVNVNNPTSLLVAGPRHALEAFGRVVLEEGALKAQLLAATLPYHHPELLAGASSALAERLGAIEWRDPICPVVSTIDGRRLTDPSELAELTAQNVATPIDWHRVVEAMASLGIDLAVECGAGALLTQNSRLSGCGPRFLSLRLWADRWQL